MKILLTGASGFIGRHLLPLLTEKAPRLLLLPHDPARATLENQYEVVTGDITRMETLPRALEGITHVIHLAGKVEGGRGEPADFMHTNADGIAALATVAREANVKQFIYTSSITVYGPVLNATEKYPVRPNTNYSNSKVAAENALRHLLPFHYTILRLPLVLGAGDTGFMIPALQSMRESGKTTIIGSGKASWSVVSAQDAARACLLALDHPEALEKIYNVVGETITNGELLRAMGALAGCTGEVKLPYAVAWIAAVISEWRGQKELTRELVDTLSQPLSMDGTNFARLGFTPTVSWQEALNQSVVTKPGN